MNEVLASDEIKPWPGTKVPVWKASPNVQETEHKYVLSVNFSHLLFSEHSAAGFPDGYFSARLT